MGTNDLRLYWRCVSWSIRGQMQYRASFLMNVLGHFLVCGAEFLGVAVLFERFGTLQGWRLPEVAVFYGLISMELALAELFARGFDELPRLVRTGEFDRLLLRPRSTALLVAGHEVSLVRFGRLGQAAVVLVWAVHALHLAWTPARVLLVAWAVAGGTCLFAGLFVWQATIAFWSTETLELMNILTYGGVETGQFPLSIYRPWFRAFFTWAVPLACVAWFPGLALLGRPCDAPVAALIAAPAAGVAFLGVALLGWGVGIRHYTSTGS